MSEESLEAPEADAAEQQATAVPEDTEDDGGLIPVPPLEADSADTAEQARDLGPDTEDEYR